MIKFKSLTLRNFQSFGNVTQTIKFDGDSLTLVLGENLDQGGGTQNRNGVGKSSVLNAMAYAIFGYAIKTSIKKDNLINDINNRNMIVSLEFEKNGHSYRIERGRKPNIFRFSVDDNLVNAAETDEAQGENRFTQHEIDRIIGFSHEMFRHTMVLSTYVEPFLDMRAQDQRAFIEELLGITQLSQKAEALKEYVKETKSMIDMEQIRINTLTASNDRIRTTIHDLQKRVSDWDNTHHFELQQLEKKIIEMDSLNIDIMIEDIQNNERVDALTREFEVSERDLKNSTRQKSQLESRLYSVKSDLEDAVGHKCPTCGQGLHDVDHEKIIRDLQDKLNTIEEEFINECARYDGFEMQFNSLKSSIGILPIRKKTYYNRLNDAYNHKSELDKLVHAFDSKTAQENPYTSQIKTLSATSIQEIDYETMNNLVSLREHQDFLVKLLTSKESNLRKRIIDQNLAVLNARLSFYLEKLGLPHEIKFMNDLGVEIMKLGKEKDFSQLSRGESNRLILALSWAFRDVFESLNEPVNIMLVDELLDSGMDPAGVESGLEILKQMSRERSKNVFLISHREELISRVSNVMMVVMEDGFTTIGSSEETD